MQSLDSENRIFTKLPQASLAQQALQSIRQAIIDGALKPGQPIRESEIASQMGTSRAPIREALLILEEEGLVERIPNRGTFVTSFSLDDVEELYSLRSVLECFGVELFVEQFDENHLDDLRDIVDKMREAAEVGDTREVNDYDLAFHEYMMAHVGHKRLFAIWRSLKFQIRRVLIAGNLLNEELDQVVKNHIPILEALKARDTEEAQRLIKQHVSDSGNRVIENWSTLHRAASETELERP